MDVKTLAAALASAQNEASFALANINFDFSLVKIKPPEDFLPLATALPQRRLDEAENGSHHVTARKCVLAAERLEMLFANSCSLV